jgi:hypothetical protein
MRCERGQASVEWVGALLAAALALAALARVADRVEAASMATTLLRSTICAVGGGCRGEHRQHGLQRRPAATHHAVTAPPLVPFVPISADPADGDGRRSIRPRRRLALPRVNDRARTRTGALWRRAWLICFGYERVRYGLLHPETRPRQTVPISGALQMANDCLSPIDFARDWELLRP